MSRSKKRGGGRLVFGGVRYADDDEARREVFDALWDVPYTRADEWNELCLMKKYHFGVEYCGILFDHYHAAKIRRAARAYGVSPTGYVRNVLSRLYAVGYREMEERRIRRIEEDATSGR